MHHTSHITFGYDLSSAKIFVILVCLLGAIWPNQSKADGIAEQALISTLVEPKAMTAAPAAPQIVRGAMCPYVRFDAGYSTPIEKLGLRYTKKFKSAPIVSIGLGNSFTEKFAADINLIYRGRYKIKEPHSVSPATQCLTSVSLMTNIYVYPYNFGLVRPYVTAGAGLSFNKAGNLQSAAGAIIGASHKSFAWQVGAGLRWKFTESLPLSMDFGYRYANLGDFKTSAVRRLAATGNLDPVPVFGGKLKTNEITIGCVYDM